MRKQLILCMLCSLLFSCHGISTAWIAEGFRFEDIRWSPDSQQFAFDAVSAHDGTDPGFRVILSYNLADETITNLTPHPQAFLISPNKKTLVFSDAFGLFRLKLDADGKLISPLEQFYYSPQISYHRYQPICFADDSTLVFWIDDIKPHLTPGLGSLSIQAALTDSIQFRPLGGSMDELSSICMERATIQQLCASIPPHVQYETRDWGAFAFQKDETLARKVQESPRQYHHMDPRGVGDLVFFGARGDWATPTVIVEDCTVFGWYPSPAKTHYLALVQKAGERHRGLWLFDGQTGAPTFIKSGFPRNVLWINETVAFWIQSPEFGLHRIDVTTMQHESIEKTIVPNWAQKQTASKQYAVQLKASHDLAALQADADSLNQHGWNAYLTPSPAFMDSGGEQVKSELKRTPFRLRVGPFSGLSEAERMKKRLADSLKVDGWVDDYEPSLLLTHGHTTSPDGRWTAYFRTHVSFSMTYRSTTVWLRDERTRVERQVVDKISNF